MTTNKIYQGTGTAIVFTETGGTLFSPKNIANGAGRVSTQGDAGAGSQPRLYNIEAQFKTQANLAVGAAVRIYIHASTTTGADYVTDASIATETLLSSNFMYVGQITGNAVAVGPFYWSGSIWLPGRYIVVGLWNASGQSLTNTNGDNKITLTPIYDDVQAAA
jgi:hypothetical protein